MTGERLDNLLVIAVQNDEAANINFEEFVDLFAKLKNRIVVLSGRDV